MEFVCDGGSEVGGKRSGGEAAEGATVGCGEVDDRQVVRSSCGDVLCSLYGRLGGRCAFHVDVRHFDEVRSVVFVRLDRGWVEMEVVSIREGIKHGSGQFADVIAKA